MLRPMVPAAVCLALAGCTYSSARLNYREHPELEAIRYWAGRKDAQGPNVGPVEASRGGWLGCDEMATAATLDLLEDARVMGGNAVVATRYQVPFHWAGRPQCRRNWLLLGHMTVRVCGYAQKIDGGSPGSAP